jgi:hypothetical protein
VKGTSTTDITTQQVLGSGVAGGNEKPVKPKASEPGNGMGFFIANQSYNVWDVASIAEPHQFDEAPGLQGKIMMRLRLWLRLLPHYI